MMEMPVTPLHKHHGQHGGLIAVLVLAATTGAVLTSQPRETREPAPKAIVTPPPLPAATVPLVEQRQTPVVEQTDLRVIRASGTITFDEDRTAHVTVPVHGWLKKTRAKTVGRTVRAGETLAVMYSPEVYLATQDLLAQINDFHSQEALDAQRYRLLRWGMSREALAAIERANKPSAALPIIARVGGLVVAEDGPREGFADPWSTGELFTVTDPTSMWLYIDAPAAAAARVTPKHKARITVEGRKPITAEVDYVFRRVEAGKRTIRLELHSRAVKPGMPAMAELALD
jgi:Cu(I)/Ag(I) efflux system membrane fusion protein